MRRDVRLNEALEIMHFGFRKLVEGPDRELRRHRLARMHHRILYFIGRNADSSVGELLAIMDITKQTLHEPLAALVARGLVDRHVDAVSHRIRRLRLTPRGAKLERKLSGAQRRRFEAIFRRTGARSERGWFEVMHDLADRRPAT